MDRNMEYAGNTRSINEETASRLGGPGPGYVGQAYDPEEPRYKLKELQEENARLAEALEWRKADRRNTALHVALSSFAGEPVGAAELIARAAKLDSFLANGDA